MGHGVVHFEINSPKAEDLKKFYAALFDWHVSSENPMAYGMVDTHAGSGINGGISAPQGDEKFVTFYIETPNVDETLTKIEKAGGKTLMPQTTVMDMVTIGMFTDPEGHVIGLVKSEDDVPPISTGKGAPVSWFEIGARDAGAMQKWYADVFGWHVNADNPMNYGEVDTHANGINGGIGPMQHEPYVTFYVGVSDLQAALDKAGSLGGTTIMPPMDVTPDTSIAMFADPDGNAIGLLKV